MLETTTYEVKTYSPEFLEDEMKLTQEFESRHQLSERYLTLNTENQINNFKTFRNNENANFPFIPTDHWYLFDEKDGLVGHIHAFPQKDTKRCTISIAYTKEGHENGAKVLLDALINSVKERGYDTLVRNTSNDHSPELDFLLKFDFKKVRLRNLRASAQRNELNIEKPNKYVIVPYSEEDHRENIITKLYLPLGYPRPQLDAQFDNIKTAQENGNVPSWIVGFDNDNIVGQSIAFYSRPGLKHIVQFNTVTTNIEGEDSIPLINDIYGSHMDKLSESVTEIEHILFGQVAHLRPIYEKVGFKYIENHLYEKQI